jgi:hypothetical protein
MLKFGAVFSASCQVIETEPDFSGWSEAASRRSWPRSRWREEVRAALAWRPAEWTKIASKDGEPVHPVEIGRAVQKLLDAPDSVLVADGGEFGQWAQATLSARHRVINGPAGSIGAALPFAAAAKLARPQSSVVAMLGDGTFGFHASELDTAVRHSLAYVAVVGNDACWNAERQIQLRAYGAARARGCELLPARYDRVAEGFGAHGEHVERASELAPALERAGARRARSLRERHDRECCGADLPVAVFIRRGRGRIRNAIGFARPRAEIDRLAALAAERPHGFSGANGAGFPHRGHGTVFTGCKRSARSRRPSRRSSDADRRRSARGTGC